MAKKNGSPTNDAHNHSRPEKFREVFLGPDMDRLAVIYEQSGKEFPSGIPK